MKRDKRFWKRLKKEERSYLSYLERANNKYGHMGGFLPDDCSECTACGTAMLGSGLCPDCGNELNYLILKGHGKLPIKRRVKKAIDPMLFRANYHLHILKLYARTRDWKSMYCHIFGRVPR